MLIVLTLTTGCRSLRSETEVSTFEENEPFDRVQIEIDLELTGDPERIELTTTKGDIELRVPPGAYSIHAESETGDVDIDAGDLTDDSASDKVITTRTDSGDIRLEGG
ncbi:MAG TPA: DUF4097 family beta strand repeat-containing protein [Myxococcota bacterium]|nr:DUF4097 family beta strand repeat-containing protein [Myxococcota bacterium]